MRGRVSFFLREIWRGKIKTSPVLVKKTEALAIPLASEK